MAVQRKIFGTPIQKGETFKYTAVIKDETGTPINITLSASITTLTVTLYNKATGVHVGSRNDQDVLGTPSVGVYPGANNHTLAANGTLTYKGVTGDTAAAATYVLRYKYTYPDAAAVTRTGIHEAEFTVSDLDAVS